MLEGTITTREELEAIRNSKGTIYLVYKWRNHPNQLLKISLSQGTKIIPTMENQYCCTNITVHWPHKREEFHRARFDILRHDAIVFTNYWLAYGYLCRNTPTSLR